MRDSHAAGMITQLGTSPPITKLRKYSTEFYKELKNITGEDTSFKETGTINIATNKSRFQEYLRQKSMSKLFDIDIDLIDKKRFKDLYPIARNSDVYGGLYIISKSAEKKLDIYEEYPTLYKKKYFKYQGKKIMTYIMPKKTKLVPPTKRYINIIKQGYKDCKLNIRSLNSALLLVKHLQR